MSQMAAMKMSRFLPPQKDSQHKNNDCGISLISPNTLYQKHSGSLKKFHVLIQFLFHRKSGTLLGPVFRRMTHIYSAGNERSANYIYIRQLLPAKTVQKSNTYVQSERCTSECSHCVGRPVLAAGTVDTRTYAKARQLLKLLKHIAAAEKRKIFGRSASLRHRHCSLARLTDILCCCTLRGRHSRHCFVSRH